MRAVQSKMQHLDRTAKKKKKSNLVSLRKSKVFTSGLLMPLSHGFLENTTVFFGLFPDALLKGKLDEEEDIVNNFAT